MDLVDSAMARSGSSLSFKGSGVSKVHGAGRAGLYLVRVTARRMNPDTAERRRLILCRIMAHRPRSRNVSIS
jgi:hypothetical protein